VVEVLLAAGADVGAVCSSGTTALMWASYASHARVVEALLTGGAKVNAVDSSGWDALRWARYGQACGARWHTDLLPGGDVVGMLQAVGAAEATRAGRFRRLKSRCLCA
jgi:hypothetical protein